MKKLSKNKLFLLALGLLTGFLLILGLVLNGATDSFDNAITKAVFELRGGHSCPKGAFYWINRILTELGYIYILIPACVLALIMGKAKPRAWFWSLGTGIVWAISEIVKNIVARERPCVFYHMMTETSPSFPSGHSMTSMYFYMFTVYVIYKSKLSKKSKGILMSVFAAIPFIIGITRINLSVHYLTDVLAGFCLGGFFVCVSILIVEYIEKRKQAK